MEPQGGDVQIVAGEPGVAGLTALQIVVGNVAGRSDLGIASDSVVLLLGTGGANDPEIYKKTSGRSVADMAEVIANSKSA